MRVLIVTLGRRGGVTEYGWLMGRALSQHADIAVVFSAAAENRHKWATLDGACLEVPTLSGPVSLVASLFAFWRFWRIRRFARAFRPDIVYYPGGHVWKPILDVVLPRLASTVLTIHDPVRHEGEDSFMWRLLGWASRRHVSGYVLLNQSQRDAFVARLGLAESQVAVIPHGLLDDYATDSSTTSDVLARAGVTPSERGRYLLFVGRIRRYKGLDTLLAAYGSLPIGDAGPLVVAGSGELSAAERASLASLQGRPVHMLNVWLTDAEVGGLVSAARFVVLPYRSATQSGVITLASAFGVPTIASATGGIVEQVVDGRTGLLVPPGDIEALRGALAKGYAMGPEEYDRLAAECRDYAAAHWSWNALSLQLLGFFDHLRR